MSYEYAEAVAILLDRVPLPSHLQKFDLTGRPAWDFDGTEEQWIRKTVCELTRLPLADWNTLTPAQRRVWVTAAIEAHRQAAEPTEPGEWVHQAEAARRYGCKRPEMGRRVKNNEVLHNGQRGRACKVFVPTVQTESPAGGT